MILLLLHMYLLRRPARAGIVHPLLNYCQHFRVVRGVGALANMGPLE